MHTSRIAAGVLCSLVAVAGCRCDEELYEIPRVGSLRGVLCGDADGQPSSGLALTVTAADGEVHTATTDGIGAFGLEDIAIGDATITIDDPAGARTGAITIEEGALVEFIDGACRAPPPPPTGNVSGCVCDDAVGAWVSAANVFVTFDSGAVAATGTDDVGCFLLEGVEPGDHTLQVQKGVFSAAHEVSVVAGETFAVPSPATCEPPPPPAEAGAVSGRVCAPDGETWLSGADIYVELEDGTRVQTTTNADGAYELGGVPAGRHTLHIVKGSFSTSRDVDVFADQTTEIPEDECSIEATELRVAVVTGDWDHVQDVLASIGINQANITMYQSNFGTVNGHVGWANELVGNYDVLSQYDIVFLNCGVGDNRFVGRISAAQPALIANLRRFVSEGGSVYASDWAYGIVEATWPDFVRFAGTDGVVDSAKVGNAPYDVTANVVDAQMALSLGQTSMELHYPLVEWAVMQDVSPQTNVYVRADAALMSGETLSNVPHTVAFRPGAGRVLFTSFHQEPGINPDMQRVLQLLIFEL